MSLGLVWKAPGLSSQDCIRSLKRDLYPDNRSSFEVGHTGTLDPFAEGLLLVGFFEGTKLLAPLTHLDKEYVATFVIGATSSSLDTESPGEFPVVPLQKAELERIAERLPDFLAGKLGTFDQIPPGLSAIKINGKRSYDLVRQGQVVEHKPRKVSLFEGEFLDRSFVSTPQGLLLKWRARLRVSAGTYIRALARDWARELSGFEGSLEKLVRSGIGPFTRRSAFAGFETLKPSDLGMLFDINNLDSTSSESLQKFGRWNPKGALEKNQLLLNPSGLAVGWVKKETGSLGRVFNRDPF